MADFTLADLEAIIAERLAEDGGGSYTRKLANAGIEKCAQKMGEEAVEAVIAAVGRDRGEFIKEAADLTYHLSVAMAVSRISWSDVFDELQARTRQSGIAEKESRANDE